MTATAPYAPEAAQAVLEPLRHRWLLLARPTGANAIPLQVSTGQVQFNEGRSPMASASLTCWPPASQDALDALDPRTGCTLEINAGYEYPTGGTDTHTLAHLRLRHRSADRPGNRMVLEATGQEIITQESTPLTDTTPPREGVGECLDWLIRQAVHPLRAEIITRVEPLHRPDLLTEAALPAGENYWSLIATIADAAGVWVRDRGDGVWTIDPIINHARAAAATLTVGPRGTITASQAQLTTDQWANTAVVVHEWTDNDGTEHRIVGTARVTSGPMDTDTQPRTTHIEHRDTPTTQDAANETAAGMVARGMTRGQTYTLEAISMYWLRPGHTITFRLPTGPEIRALVSQVAFRFPSGDMTVTTRTPDDAEITTGA